MLTTGYSPETREMVTSGVQHNYIVNVQSCTQNSYRLVITLFFLQLAVVVASSTMVATRDSTTEVRNASQTCSCQIQVCAEEQLSNLRCNCISCSSTFRALHSTQTPDNLQHMCQGIAQKVQTLCHEYWHGILHKALNLYREDIINSKSSSLQMHKHHTLLCLSCMVKLVIVLCLQIPTIFPWWSHLAQVQGPGLPPCVLWGAL